MTTIGTDRENRVTPQVAEHILKEAQSLNLEDAQFELIDIAGYDLPLFNEPVPPTALEEYSSPNIARWSEKNWRDEWLHLRNPRVQ